MRIPPGPDWISLVEDAYNLDDEFDTWLARVLRAFRRVIPSEAGVVAHLFDCSAGRLRLIECRFDGDPSNLRILPDLVARVLPNAACVSTNVTTLSDSIALHLPDAPRILAEATQGAYTDALGVTAFSGAGVALGLGAPIKTRDVITPFHRRQLWRAAAHVAAGLRLRYRLAHTGVSEAVEATFTPGGRLLDVAGPAGTRSARESLVSAVSRAGLARGPLRESPDQGLALWEALVSGRWSLVETRRDGDTRHIVAVRNEPDVIDPRGLSPREAHIADLLGRGQTAKEIGYLLGVSVAGVNNALTRVRHKLRLRSRAELAEFFSAHGMRTGLAVARIDDHTEILTGAYSTATAAADWGLTDAEHAVARLALAGRSTAEVARHRATSPKTVANQLQSVYAKVGVTSRAELAVRLAGSLRPPASAHAKGAAPAS
ncbi:MAG: LuxR C-terminal-related transcriptional regulator [Vicinamibacterales bacterium]